MNNTSLKALPSFDTGELTAQDECIQLAEPDHKAKGYMWLQRLYRILTHQNSFPAQDHAIACFLEQGCIRFADDLGMVLKPISEEVFEVQACSFQAKDVYIGQHISTRMLPPLSQLPEGVGSVSLQHFDASAQSLLESVDGHPLMSCFSTGFSLSNGESYLLCFLGFESSESQSDSKDVEFLELMAEGIVSMMDSHANTVQRKTHSLELVAQGSVKSLEEYQQIAVLPQGTGISVKVANVLKKHIGSESLSIDSVARDLNLSKRTLQRRLQQQDLHFADIRDRVRFHYAIHYLVYEKTPIDRISSILDFSDRTSFTNAFKRWSGLCPRLFRKLFRDYV